jgi:RecA-family ATPase
LLDLARAVARNPVAGDPLPLPWPKLAKVVVPRRAQTVMVYGPSGCNKSMFVLNWVLDLGLPTLYVSADTDHHDMAYRVECRRQQMTLAQVEQGVAAGYLDLTADLADLREWLRFCFEPSPTIDDLEVELLAFTEQFGAPPEVVVIDTLSDVQCGDEDEYRSMRKVMRAVHHVSRTTGALCIVVHHATGEWEDAATRRRGAASTASSARSPS